jgi:hypothetical protein
MKVATRTKWALSGRCRSSSARATRMHAAALFSSQKGVSAHHGTCGPARPCISCARTHSSWRIEGGGVSTTHAASNPAHQKRFSKIKAPNARKYCHEHLVQTEGSDHTHNQISCRKRRSIRRISHASACSTCSFIGVSQPALTDPGPLSPRAGAHVAVHRMPSAAHLGLLLGCSCG